MSSLRNFVTNCDKIIQTSSGMYLLSVALLLCGFLMLRYLPRAKLKLPPGPIGLPLIGYLLFLGKEPFRTLDKLRHRYGNVFSLYLGPKYVVVLGDYAAVKEGYSKNEMLDRPPGVLDFMPDGGGMADANGREWTDIRRFVMKSMRDLGLGRNTWERLLEDEVADFLELIVSKKDEPMDVGKSLMSSVANNISSLVFGKRLPPGKNRDMLNSSVDTLMKFFSTAGLWNYFPWLCNMLVKLKIGSYHRSLSEISVLNTFVRNETEIRRKTLDSSEESDFVSHFIEAMNSDEGKRKDTVLTERHLIGSTQGLYAAGSETSKTSLIWLFLAMTNFPKIQEKVHLELDTVLGRQRKALWEDRFKLPYTFAVIMEAQRWKTIVPLNVVRMATEDFKLCGYDIPKGSMITSNLWALHNDPRYWEEPEKFNPERFLQNEGKDINMKVESFAPFSLGKRKCPGETVALMEIFLYFTSIMQKCEIQVPNGGKPKLDGFLGITYMPLDQDLCFIPR